MEEVGEGIRIHGMESGRLHDRLNAVHAALLARSTTPDDRGFPDAAASLGCAPCTENPKPLRTLQ